MKRILSLILTIILIIGAFSACNGNSKQYFEDDYNAFLSQNQSSEQTNMDTPTLNEVSDNKNSNLNSTESNNSSSNENSFNGSSSNENSSNGSSSNNSTSSGNSSNNSSANGSPSAPTSSNTTGAIKANQLPTFTYGGGKKATYVQDDRYIHRAEGTKAADYNSYLKDLLKLGFTKYAENKIGDNLFATLTNKVTRVTLSFMKADGVTMAIAEPQTYLYPRKQDNNYKSKNLKSYFTGMNGSTIVANEGMGFFFRLDDGSFIVIDSSNSDPYHFDSTKILKILQEQSPEGTEKPVIAAWFFTHCHGDHIGSFNTFAIDHRDKAIIESLYCNFPPVAALRKSSPHMFDGSIYRYDQFKKAMNDYYPQVPKIRTYTGDKYYIRNAVVEVLFSYENLFPKSAENGNYTDGNYASLIFRITIDGQTFMITGDSETPGFEFATRNYGSYLKSDFLQMAHHGWNDNLDFYSTVNPTYALLPVNFKNFESALTNKSYKGNQWLVNSPNVRQIIEFSKSNVTIPIPYNPADKDIFYRIPTSTSTYKKYTVTKK